MTRYLTEIVTFALSDIIILNRNVSDMILTHAHTHSHTHTHSYILSERQWLLTIGKFCKEDVLEIHIAHFPKINLFTVLLMD